MSSATTDSRSEGSKIEKPGFNPADFASIRRILETQRMESGNDNLLGLAGLALRFQE